MALPYAVNQFIALEMVKVICWLSVIFIYKNYHIAKPLYRSQPK